MKQERLRWFGKIEGGKAFLYKNLRSDSTGVLADLREGRIPETDLEPVAQGEMPDLRTVALEFARKRIEDEFSRDQKLIKFLSLKIELDRMINLYYEKITGFGVFFGVDPVTMDPCRLFREPAPESDDSGMLAEAMKEGKQLCDLRSKIIDYSRSETKALLPNTSELAGEDIAGEILLHAGSLKRAGEFPAGTIQVLGAEKAFFKHLTSGSLPPKHGLIFKFPGITALPKKMRGKAARMVANKISICLRADLVGRRMDAAEMKNKLKEKITSLRGQ